MAKHTEIGRKGEQIAVNFLKNKGYELLACNWRSGHKEIDIIARGPGCLVMAEVKTRSGFAFGFPEEAVTPLKQTALKMAAEAYCLQYAPEAVIRFDVISVHLPPGGQPEIHHIEDAFY